MLIRGRRDRADGTRWCQCFWVAPRITYRGRISSDARSSLGWTITIKSGSECQQQNGPSCRPSGPASHASRAHQQVAVRHR